ncbi:MAG: transposase [Chromatiales bacterium]|nr:transposase [Chromatiales bacterium]
MPAGAGAQVKNQEFIEGHLHACRLPPAPAAEARRRAQAEAKKAGRQIRPRTLALAEWVLIFTTVPPAVLPTATVLALYRVRWQVELAIKRLKSILNIDQAPRPQGRPRWPTCTCTASCSMPGWSRNGRAGAAATTGIAWTARAAPPRGGYGNCCARNWPSPSAACCGGT